MNAYLAYLKQQPSIEKQYAWMKENKENLINIFFIYDML